MGEARDSDAAAERIFADALASGSLPAVLGGVSTRAEAEERLGMPLDELRTADVGAVVRESGPRVVLDTAGPVAAFYVAWKAAGLTAGILLACAAGLALWWHAQRHGRPGAIARLVLAVVVARAAIGLLAGDTTVYLAQEVAMDVAVGAAMGGSLLAGRPLTALLAQDVYAFPPAVRDSATYRATFGRITLAWTAYFLVAATVRGVALATLDVDAYVVVSTVVGAPCILAVLVWSVRHAVGAFRASPEWGDALALLDAVRTSQAEAVEPTRAG